MHEWLYSWSRWGWPLLADHLWLSTLFAISVLIIIRLIRGIPARIRYAILLVLFLKFLLPPAPLVSLAGLIGLDPEDLPNRPVFLSRIAEPVSQSVESITLDSETFTAVHPLVENNHNEIYCALTAIWLIGFLLALFLWRRRYRALALIYGSGVRVSDGRVFESLERARHELGIKRAVGLCVSQEAIEPAIWRHLKPVVVLPERMAEDLSDDELDAVLTHELVHVLRRDNLMSNLQMFLCCMLWFHPLVWLLDRLLLAERESACDERVIELGIEAGTYASSLLKVLRFCLGWRVAGISSAAGSNIQKRIGSILSKDINRRIVMAHRLMVCSTVAGAIILSMMAALLSPNYGFAVTARGSQAAVAGPSVGQDNQPAPSPNPNRTPEAKGSHSLSSTPVKDGFKYAMQAAYTPVRFENTNESPVSITDAKLKIVPLSGVDNQKELELATMPAISMINRTDRTITLLKVSLKLRGFTHDVTVHKVDIGPYGSYTLQMEAKNWSSIVDRGRAKDFVITIAKAEFRDSGWELLKEENRTPEPAPEAKATEEQPTPKIAPEAESNREWAVRTEDFEYIPAKYINPEEAPLIIIEAKTPIGKEDGRMSLPIVKLANKTKLRITGLKLRFKANKDEHAVTALRTDIGPYGTYLYHPTMRMGGRPEDMRVQVLGVEFENGEVWGSMDSQINSRDEWIPVR